MESLKIHFFTILTHTTSNNFKKASALMQDFILGPNLSNTKGNEFLHIEIRENDMDSVIMNKDLKRSITSETIDVKN